MWFKARFAREIYAGEPAAAAAAARAFKTKQKLFKIIFIKP